MTARDFDFLREFLREACGIALADDKQYLVEGRLVPVLARLGLPSVAEFAAELRANPFGRLRKELVDALVTAESLFFRDVRPWETLRTIVLPELIRARAAERRLRCWCAATAGGQEPYSLALLLRGRFPELAGWQVEIVATDVSPAQLDRARAGLYSQLEVNRGLPAALLVKHFQPEGLAWRLNADIRRMVEFRELNLCRPWPALPPCDLILLRNVMIYFNAEAKSAILVRVARVLRPDGYLLLGAAETTLHLAAPFRPRPDLPGGFHQPAGGSPWPIPDL